MSTKTGQALQGEVVLSAPEGALIKTGDGLRYFSGAGHLLPLPSNAGIKMVGAGLPPCLLNERSEVWCLSGIMSPSERPHFERGPQIPETDPGMTWNKLRRAPGPVAGLAGNIDIGCILLDGATATQCWRREIAPPWSSLSAKMPLGPGRTAKQIVAGSEHFCVLAQNGEVGCWGDSSFGQTGYMAETMPEDRPEFGVPWRNRRTPPTTFSKFDSPAKQLAASAFASCALLENGKLWCWGDTDAFAFEDPKEPTFLARMESDRSDPRGGQLPKALNASTMPHSPIKLPSACHVKSFSLISEQLCVSCEGGCSKCWGKSWATPTMKKAEPPDECLTY